MALDTADTARSMAVPVQGHQLDQCKLTLGAALRFPPAAPQVPEAGFDTQVKLKSFLQTQAPGFAGKDRLQLLQFSFGQSNPTYFFEAGGAKYVLRKKPHGQVLASAHAVDREYRVLKALQDTPAPVPPVVCLCQDDSVIGTPFYVMQHLQGTVYTNSALPDLPAQQRRAIYHGMASTLAALHSVQPAAVGLSDYGRSSGYCARQVWRWAQQYRAQLSGEPMPEMMQLHAWLQANVPASDGDASQTRIAHGDYKLDNLIFSTTRAGQVLGIVDWELSTLGHPLADLAYSAMPFHLRASPSQSVSQNYTLPDPLPSGIPSEQEYVDVYCKARGIQPPDPHDWCFFVALGLFRMAAILAGVGARAKLGNASSAQAATVGAPEVIRGMAQTALHLVTSTLGPDALHSKTAARSETQRAASGRHTSTSSSSASSPSQAQSSGFGPSPRVQALLKRVQAFIAQHVEPADAKLEELAMSDKRWTVHPLVEELKRKAKQQGLWNLYIPSDMAERFKAILPEGEEGKLLSGPGLTNLEYAHLSEQMGKYPWASEVFNCGAPDTGNMEVLARYGSPQQQRTWLLPLLRGDIRSCFAMTEPDVASSDATNIQSSIRREGGSWVLSGRKWWASGAMDPRCKIAIFMGKSSPSAAKHKQQSMVLVPLDTPGVRIIRPMTVYGYDDAPHGHAEVVFEDVRVGSDAMILGEGRGFEIAQGRLGPGRLHHCMRCIGMGQRALELMMARAQQRVVFGKPISQHGGFLQQLAQAAVDLDGARLVVLHAAHTLDCVGNQQARKQIAHAKITAPSVVQRVIDQAIQVHGGAGVSQDTALARLWAHVRTLRLADGPDDVHAIALAKMELSANARRLSRL